MQASQTDEARWSSLLLRDRQARFYYAVRTTGVYCRSGCTSRLPKRDNVEFFESCSAAEGAGYRACKRCQPTAERPALESKQAELIERACRRLEKPEPRAGLEDLAQEAKLSPWHFHRLFKRATGVTPRQYAAQHRLRQFGEQLRGKPTVTDAIVDAGFGSSSRAYEGNPLGMTPSAYRKGGAGLCLRYAVAPCFLGWIGVATTELGICAVELDDAPEALAGRLQSRFPGARLVLSDDTGFGALVRQVIGALEAPRQAPELPLDIQGTAFQRRVWSALRQVPPGSPISYAGLASSIGRPTAARAVAGACAANPIAGLIPCHRVLRGDGELGGYRWGLDRKRKLLDREREATQELKERPE